MTDTTVATLALQLTGDASGASNAFRAATAEGKRYEKALGSITYVGKQMASAGKIMSVAITLPLVLAGRAAKDLGMAALDAKGLFATAFRGMEAEAGQWAASFSRTMKVNRYDLMAEVAGVQLLGRNMGLTSSQAFTMAKGLAESSRNMAAMLDADPSAVLDALKKAIAGSYKGLKEYNIVMDAAGVKTYAWSHGIAAQGQTLTKSQESLAAYAMVMEQMAISTGAWAEELKDPEGQIRAMGDAMREVGATAGVIILPVLGKLSDMLRSVADAFLALPPGAQSAIVAVGATAAVIGPLLLITAKAIEVFKTLGVTKTVLGRIFGGATVATVADTVSTVLNTAAITANTTAVGLNATARRMAAETDVLGEDAVADAATWKAARAAVSPMPFNVRMGDTALYRLQEALRTQREALRTQSELNLTPALAAETGVVVRNAAALASNTAAAGLNATAQRMLAGATMIGKAGFGDLAKVLGSASKGITVSEHAATKFAGVLGGSGGLGSAFSSVSGFLGPLLIPLGALAAVFGVVYLATKKWGGGVSDLADSTTRFRYSVDSTTKDLDTHAVTIRQATAASRGYSEQLEVLEAASGNAAKTQNDLSKAIDGVAASLAEQAAMREAQWASYVASALGAEGTPEWIAEQKKYLADRIDFAQRAQAEYNAALQPLLAQPQAELTKAQVKQRDALSQSILDKANEIRALQGELAGVGQGGSGGGGGGLSELSDALAEISGELDIGAAEWKLWTAEFRGAETDLKFQVAWADQLATKMSDLRNAIASVSLMKGKDADETRELTKYLLDLRTQLAETTKEYEAAKKAMAAPSAAQTELFTRAADMAGEGGLDFGAAIEQYLLQWLKAGVVKTYDEAWAAVMGNLAPGLTRPDASNPFANVEATVDGAYATPWKSASGAGPKPDTEWEKRLEQGILDYLSLLNLPDTAISRRKALVAVGGPTRSAYETEKIREYLRLMGLEENEANRAMAADILAIPGLGYGGRVMSSGLIEVGERGRETIPLAAGTVVSQGDAEGPQEIAISIVNNFGAGVRPSDARVYADAMINRQVAAIRARRLGGVLT